MSKVSAAGLITYVNCYTSMTDHVYVYACSMHNFLITGPCLIGQPALSSYQWVLTDGLNPSMIFPSFSGSSGVSSFPATSARSGSCD